MLLLIVLDSGLLSQNLQHLVYVLDDDDVVGLLARLVWNVNVLFYGHLVVVVLRLLSQVVQVLVQGVDVIPFGEAVEGAVVEVRHRSRIC